jgi:hypothetical protein
MLDLVWVEKIKIQIGDSKNLAQLVIVFMVVSTTSLFLFRQFFLNSNLLALLELLAVLQECF